MPYLPISRVVKDKDGRFHLNYDYSDSIGYIASFYGNFAVTVRAFAYILMLGREGLCAVGDHAVLNANYMMAKLKDKYHLPYDRMCMHEFVLEGRWPEAKGIHALDISKRLMDFGFHPPTNYFPLIVPEALMIQANAHAAMNFPVQALDLLREARAVAEQIGQRRILWQILALLSELEEQQGNSSEARTCREEARNIIDYIADHSSEELRASFLSLPEVMSLLAK